MNELKIEHADLPNDCQSSFFQLDFISPAEISLGGGGGPCSKKGFETRLNEISVILSHGQSTKVKNGKTKQWRSCFLALLFKDKKTVVQAGRQLLFFPHVIDRTPAEICHYLAFLSCLQTGPSDQPFNLH